MSSLSTDQKIDAIYQKFVAGDGTSAAPPVSVVPWTRNPGEPVVAGVTCFDNPTEAKRYAAQGFSPNGVPAPLDIPLAAALDRADKLLAAKTSAETEAIVKGTQYLDPETAAYASLTGWVVGGGLGGSPYMGLGPVSLAYLIRQPGGPTVSVSKP